jgi:hypothetical protein
MINKNKTWNSFTNSFEKNYFDNFANSVSGKQFNSLSVKIIYFLDYLTLKRKKKELKEKE